MSKISEIKEKIKNIIEYADKKIDLKKFFKFGITGLLNTAVDFIVYTFCLVILRLDIKIAQPIGQAVAIVNSYIINKNWTFKKSGDKKNNYSINYNIKEIIKFLLINGGSIVINIFGVYIFHDVLGVNEFLCKVPIAIITIIINYFGNKLFVFK